MLGGPGAGVTGEDGYGSAHRESVAGVADLALLQEVGPPEMLERLQAALARKMPRSALSDGPDDRGIRVAILSSPLPVRPRRDVSPHSS